MIRKFGPLLLSPFALLPGDEPSERELARGLEVLRDQRVARAAVLLLERAPRALVLGRGGLRLPEHLLLLALEVELRPVPVRPVPVAPPPPVTATPAPPAADTLPASPPPWGR